MNACPLRQPDGHTWQAWLVVFVDHRIWAAGVQIDAQSP